MNFNLIKENQKLLDIDRSNANVIDIKNTENKNNSDIHMIQSSIELKLSQVNMEDLDESFDKKESIENIEPSNKSIFSFDGDQAQMNLIKKIIVTPNGQELLLNEFGSQFNEIKNLKNIIKNLQEKFIFTERKSEKKISILRNGIKELELQKEANQNAFDQKIKKLRISDESKAKNFEAIELQKINLESVIKNREKIIQDREVDIKSLMTDLQVELNRNVEMKSEKELLLKINNEHKFQISDHNEKLLSIEKFYKSELQKKQDYIDKSEFDLKLEMSQYSKKVCELESLLNNEKEKNESEYKNFQLNLHKALNEVQQLRNEKNLSEKQFSKLNNDLKNEIEKKTKELQDLAPLRQKIRELINENNVISNELSLHKTRISEVESINKNLQLIELNKKIEKSEEINEIQSRNNFEAQMDEEKGKWLLELSELQKNIQYKEDQFRAELEFSVKKIRQFETQIKQLTDALNNEQRRSQFYRRASRKDKSTITIETPFQPIKGLGSFDTKF